MGKTCNNCYHVVNTDVPYGKNTITCEIHTCLILYNTSAEKCPFYNQDIGDKPICLNCKHFLGGADWGLACAKHYHNLPDATTEMCEDAEWKGDKDGNTEN